MKRILINAAHNEEVRVALCNGNHLYDFDLENRTREQKKSNIYKGRITRIEQSLEAVFVEYGSQRQGFLPLREIAPEYLHANPREESLKKVIKEGDELIVQVEKEERGNKGAALSTYISLAGRYLVLMPNNSKGGGISRQISGKVRDEMRQILANLTLPKGMSVIVRTAGIGRTYEDLQTDLDHLLETWSNIQETSFNDKAPILLHQEASVVTRAVRDYLRDDIGEVWIDNEYAYNEAAHFISQVMPAQMSKLRKYTEFEPIFVRFGIERQIETAYQREVRLPSGGSIVIDQTEAMVSIDINSSKSTKGSDVAETAYHTNLEAADEIARQLRLRDMGGLIVIDFIDMANPHHQKEVEKRLQEATRYDRARIQFAEISKFGLLEMSRQRLRPSLDEATGYICPRCHGNGMIRDVRSLALSIMRKVEQLALQNQYGEIQVDVPTEIAAFLLNEKRESLVYLEQDTGVRITILPHAHLESPNFDLHFNPDGFAPATYERIVDVEKQQADRGYEVNWQTQNQEPKTGANHWQQNPQNTKTDQHEPKASKSVSVNEKPSAPQKAEPAAVAWLSNLFAPKPQANLAHSFNNQDAASAIESIVNTGATSLGAMGQIALPHSESPKVAKPKTEHKKPYHKDDKEQTRHAKSESKKTDKTNEKSQEKPKHDKAPKREAGSVREARGEIVRQDTLTPKAKIKDNVDAIKEVHKPSEKADKPKMDNKSMSEKGTDKAQDNTPMDTTNKVNDTIGDKTNDKTIDKISEKTDKTLDKATDKNAPQKTRPVPQKIQKSDKEFALHILPVAQPVASKIVHLPLDEPKAKISTNAAHLDTKPMVQASEQTEQAIAETATKTTNVPTDQQPVDSQNVPQVPQNDTPLQANDGSENNGQENKDASGQTNSQVGQQASITLTQNALPADAQADTQTNRQIDNQQIDDSHADNAQKVSNGQINDKKTNNTQADKQAKVSQNILAHCINTRRNAYQEPVLTDILLAKHLATRKKLAHNDPRIVLMAQETTPKRTMTGTVGDFIRQTLGENAIAKDGVVLSFIKAMANTGVSAPFANYGYAALSDEHWDNFIQKIATSGQYAVNSGKTKAVPPAGGERAKNDPRNFLTTPTAPKTPNVDNVDDTNQASNQIANTAIAIDNQKSNQMHIESQSSNGAFDEPVSLLQKVANATGEEGFVAAIMGERASTLIAEQGLKGALLTALDSLDGALDKLQDLLPNELTTHEKNPKKDYRNMIEGIAEQLLPQTGILNLSKPTPVKIKIKKNKDKSNKPKVEIVRRKNDDQTGE